MRDFTKEESEAYNKSLNNIFKPIGVNIKDPAIQALEPVIYVNKEEWEAIEHIVNFLYDAMENGYEDEDLFGYYHAVTANGYMPLDKAEWKHFREVCDRFKNRIK